MVEDISGHRARILGKFHRSVEQWVCRQNEQPLTHWLARELDSRGTLWRLPISDWHVCLEALREARRSRPRWPGHWEESVARLVIATLRFSRPDGSPAGDFNRSSSFASPETTLERWLAAVEGTETARYLRDWQASRQRDVNFTPEVAAWDASRRVLSVLRDQVGGNGDFVAVDHRESGPSCRFELFGSGRSWLGPSWTIEGGPGATTPPRPGPRISVSGAEIAEWSYRVGPARVTQTILLLGGRRMALLSALFEARAPLSSSLSVRLSCPPSIKALPLAACRGFRLNGPKRRESAQVLPIGLPCLPYETDRGALVAQDNVLLLGQAPAGRRCWLPLLVSWDSARSRRRASWRILTVSERGKAVPPDRAFAVRVSWGAHETYVIYRSLDPPAPRAFLGYRTAARFLIGLFTQDGNLTPIVKIE
jgi:hypothetical protein